MDIITEQTESRRVILETHKWKRKFRHQKMRNEILWTIKRVKWVTHAADNFNAIFKLEDRLVDVNVCREGESFAVMTQCVKPVKIMAADFDHVITAVEMLLRRLDAEIVSQNQKYDEQTRREIDIIREHFNEGYAIEKAYSAA